MHMDTRAHINTCVYAHITTTMWSLQAQQGSGDSKALRGPTKEPFPGLWAQLWPLWGWQHPAQCPGHRTGTTAPHPLGGSFIPSGPYGAMPFTGSRQVTCAEPSSCPERVLGRRLEPRARRPRRSHRWAHGTHVPQGRYKATCGGACVLSPAVITRQPAAPQASTLAVPELCPSVMSSHSTNVGP